MAHSGAKKLPLRHPAENPTFILMVVLNFVILGLAVSSVNPRAGNSTSLMIALFAFIVYYNLMTLGESWVGASKISMWGLLGLLHGGIFAGSVLVLLARHFRWSPRDLLRSAGRREAAR